MTTIKLRRGTASEWTTANPILAAGEMGIETDTRKFKFGDGATNWNTLPYASTGGGGTGDVTAAGDNKFTGENTFTGKVNIAGAPLTVDGLTTLNQATVTYLNATSITSNGEINAVSIKANGIRSDDIQTTTNKKYLTEEDVDNQTIQIVDGKLHANLDELGNEVNDLSGRVTANEADIATKQDKLSDGNGTKINSNKVDINQGTAGIQGLTLYQGNGSITKDTDQNITFENGACGYIYFTNKGVNNNYEIVLHCNYRDKHGSRDDSDIHGIRTLDTTTFPSPTLGQGMSWVDTYYPPFRAIIVNKNSTQDYGKDIPTVNYIKYTIVGTKIQQYYSTDGVTYTSITYNNNLDYCEISDTLPYLNLCIANRNSSSEFESCWTNTILYSDSYILDKSTDTYLMKLGTTLDNVAIATSTAYGLVMPDGRTIKSTNGIISANIPDTSKFLDKSSYSTQTMNGSLIVNGGVTQCSKFRMRSSGTGSIQYTNTTLSKTMFVFRGVSGSYPILIGDASQNIQIDGSKVLFNSTLTRKVNDSTEATILDSNNISTYATGLAFPSNRYIDLTPGANGTSYTAPADGWIAFAKKLTATGQFAGLSNNTIGMSTMGCNATDGSGGNTSCFIPCKKGDEVVTWYSAGGDVLALRFIYAEGAQ